MLKPIHQLINLQNASNATRDWRELIASCGQVPGERTAAQKKLLGAINLLLRFAELTPEHALLDLDWFARTFPRAPKVPLPVKLKTYTNARHRVRPAIRRLTSGGARDKADGWESVCDLVFDLRGGARGADLSTIPLRSTLTRAARARGIAPSGLTQAVLVDIHDAMLSSSERSSLRRASRLLSSAQACFPEVAAKLPHPIEPIRAEDAARYLVPFRLEHQIEDLETVAARKRYIEVTEEHEMVADGTRIGMRTALRALVDGLIRSGHLDPEAETFLPLLHDSTALKAALKVQVDRVRRGEIVARHAATLVRRLPVIFDRNGIPSAELRRLIADPEEFKLPDFNKLETPMTPKTIKFCRTLIESPSHRQRFLCAHKILRQKASALIASARRRKKKLSPSQRKQVIRMGTVALFCAIETGGAPIRVRNVLGMRYGGSDAWLRPTAEGFRVTISAGNVKNRRDIAFPIKRGANDFAETISWYLKSVRPLMLENADEGSGWLIPMLSDPSRHCCYETFLDWFERLMRDEVELPCTPHNFRHGQASLLYHAHPECLDAIAQRLGNSPRTVVKHYAWVHQELAMIEGQKLLTDMIKEAA